MGLRSDTVEFFSSVSDICAAEVTRNRKRIFKYVCTEATASGSPLGVYLLWKCRNNKAKIMFVQLPSLSLTGPPRGVFWFFFPRLRAVSGGERDSRCRGLMPMPRPRGPRTASSRS